jgi:hypothetical protein
MTFRSFTSHPATALVAVLISCASLLAFILVIRYPFTTRRECAEYDGFYCRPSTGQFVGEECPGKCWCLSVTASERKCGDYQVVTSTAKWAMWKLPVLIVTFCLVMISYVFVAFTCMCRDVKDGDDGGDDGEEIIFNKSGRGEEVYIAMQDSVAITASTTDGSASADSTSSSHSNAAAGDESLSTSSSSSSERATESIEITFEDGTKRIIKGVDPRTIPARAWL